MQYKSLKVGIIDIVESYCMHCLRDKKKENNLMLIWKLRKKENIFSQKYIFK